MCRFGNSLFVELEVPRNLAVMKIRQPNIPKFGIELVNSCNGLICMRKNGRIYISNPTMCEHLTLPIATQDHSTRSVCGFGCSQKFNNQYKVIQISNPLSFPDDKLVAEIFRVGSSTWRWLGDVPYSFRYRSSATFLNGALHWVLDYPESSELICAFQLDSEKFQPVPPPPNPGENICWLNLGLIEGCLCISCFQVHSFSPSFSTDIEIWVMKDYGVRESWVREIVVKHPMEHRWDPFGFELIQVMKSGGVLMLCNFRPLLYDPVTKTFGRVEFHGIQSPEMEATVYVPSFFSLKRVVTGQS